MVDLRYLVVDQVEPSEESDAGESDELVPALDTVLLKVEDSETLEVVRVDFEL